MSEEKRTALVTGASGGIGRAIAESLGAGGYRVAVNYNANERGACETVAAISATGGEAIAIQADVSRRTDCERLFARIEAEYGFVAYLVNNAGVTDDAPLMLLSDEQWDRVIGTNLGGTRLCSQLALPGMMRLGGGAITNIVSPSGVRGQSGQCNYSAAKEGAIAFTKALAREMGRYDIRVNAVCPGLIRTRLTERYFANPEILRNYFRQIPLGRGGEPDEVAQASVFLASGLASYITGATLFVDGGQMASKFGTWTEDTAEFRDGRWRLR